MLSASHRFDFPESHLVGIIVHAPFFPNRVLNALQFEVVCRKTFANEVIGFSLRDQHKQETLASNQITYITSFVPGPTVPTVPTVTVPTVTVAFQFQSQPSRKIRLVILPSPCHL